MFAIDARYHGERQGIGVLRAIARLDTLYKMFRLTVIDMRRALDYLDSRGFCDPAGSDTRAARWAASSARC